MESTICSKQINAYLLENVWEEYLFISQTAFDLHFSGNGVAQVDSMVAGTKGGAVVGEVKKKAELAKRARPISV